jgi:hypothetical protein
MTKPMTCFECGAAMSGPPSKKFCNNAHAAKFKRKQKLAEKKASAVPVECANCGAGFAQNHANQRHCSKDCAAAFARRPHAARAEAAIVEDAVRILSDGFYLPDLPGEIERIRKVPGIAAALEAALMAAVMDDALWPVGKPGRIAVVLALLKNPALASAAKWRHVHERRRLPGQPRLPTGTGIRAHGTPGSRV